MADHTRGPYDWFDEIPGVVDFEGGGGDGYPMTVFAVADDEPVCYPDTGYRSPEEARANAALLSAAPALLAAVEAFIDAARGYAGVPVPEDTARALIDAMLLGVSARDKAQGGA